MSVEDYFDIYGEPDDGDEPDTLKTCKRCGIGMLHWEEEDIGRYRLYTVRNMLHVCKPKHVAKMVDTFLDSKLPGLEPDNEGPEVPDDC